ncbi:MAG: type II toxin-antitoxin system VapC family toxin [Candidatus Binataceae bacterium]
MNYFDTSALIKRFVEESGSQRVAALLDEEPMLATSKVAYAEVHAGLARKLRARALTPTAYRRVAASFEGDWRAIVRVEVTDALLLIVRDLARRHPLRGFDAIHLASALRLRDQLGEDVRFVAADDRLLIAAAAEDLEAMDVRR